MFGIITDIASHMVRPCGHHRFRICGFFLGLNLERERITCFVDGFNLYHALADIGENHLKWLDLKALFLRLTRSKSQIITQILFFSAYPTWKPAAYHRHRQYIAALSATGITPVMGQFKNKRKRCQKCKTQWTNHEEKETDVNMALALLDLAYKDQYDHAFLLTRDSDFAPAVHKVKQNFPNKKITVFAPYNYRHSSELIQAADGHKSTNLKHLSTSLLPSKVYDAGGNLVVERPIEYVPSYHE
ncbi:MAG: hypothetical protein S4CHLAM2_02910 [Chlamydiales bacterium]|nr:hypothetical protein [Chlamydiales bacterium]